LDFLQFPAFVKCQQAAEAAEAVATPAAALQRNRSRLQQRTRPAAACVFPPVFYHFTDSPLFIS